MANLLLEIEEQIAGEFGNGASFAEKRGVFVSKFGCELAFRARDELRAFAAGGDVYGRGLVEFGGDPSAIEILYGEPGRAVGELDTDLIVFAAHLDETEAVEGFTGAVVYGDQGTILSGLGGGAGSSKAALAASRAILAAR